MDLKELIFSICSLMSISSFEETAHEDLLRLVGDNFDEVKKDAVGNLVLIKRSGINNAPKILIDTHLDEIGMMVTAINDNGMLSVTSIGGLDRSILQASDVVIYGKEKLRGVISSTPPHLSSASERVI